MLLWVQTFFDLPYVCPYGNQNKHALLYVLCRIRLLLFVAWTRKPVVAASGNDTFRVVLKNHYCRTFAKVVEIK